MQALKKFLSSSHFITLITLCFFSMLMFVGLLDLPIHKSLQDAKASVRTNLEHSKLDPEEILINSIENEAIEIKGSLIKGDTLGKAFQRNKIPPQATAQIFKYLENMVDFKKLRPGNSYSIKLDSDNELLQCIYEISPLESYTIKSTEIGFMVERDKKILETKKIRISGQISNTLFDAFPPDIKTPKLVYAFADIFSSRIDFNTETRTGDTFALVVEEYYLDGDFIGYGPILAGKYERTNDEYLEAFNFSPDKEINSYFDRDGKELGSSFLRSPVGIGRVSSRFSWRRKHPILGVVRQHLGVDLAAPYGTPVMAAADGKIVSRGTNGGFGNQIIIAHGNDYRTHYGHLSRFAKNLQVGSRVQQKQIIGYVGSSGLSTGPHLDYRLQHHGTFQNPFTFKYRPKSTLVGEKLAQLREIINPLISELSAANPNYLLATRRVTIANGQQISLL